MEYRFLLWKKKNAFVHYKSRRETAHGDTRRRGPSFHGRTKGDSSLSHVKLVADESRQFNVSVSEAVPSCQVSSLRNLCTFAILSLVQDRTGYEPCCLGG